jgi:hypothetical protein
MFDEKNKNYKGFFAGQNRMSVVLFTQEDPIIEYVPIESGDEETVKNYLQDHHSKQNNLTRKIFEEMDPELSQYFYKLGGINGTNGYVSFIGDDEEEIEEFVVDYQEKLGEYMEKTEVQYLLSGFVFSFAKDYEEEPSKYPLAEKLVQHLRDNYYRVTS